MALQKYYHVTTEENLASIRSGGLLPRIGPRSEELGETEERVYLFGDFDEAIDAAVNWLGEIMEPSGPVILEAKIESSLVMPDEDGFALVTCAAVPPERLRVMPDPPESGAAPVPLLDG